MVGLGKAVKVSAALAGGSVILWLGFCGPLASAFDTPGYWGSTGPFTTIGIVFFYAALVLVPLTVVLAVVWGIRALVRRGR